MVGLIREHKWMLCVLVVLVALTMTACGGKKKQETAKISPPPAKVEIPPEPYTDAGIRLLDQALYDDAAREFAWALKKDKKNARALISQGLAQVYQGGYKAALDSLEDGCKYAKHDVDRLFCKVGWIRLYTIDRRDKRWFLETKEAFNEALKIDPRSSDAYYYMGFAYKEHLNFDDAGRMFNEVIVIKERHVKEAEAELAKIKDIQQAMATSKTGRNIAMSPYVTRGDCAALLIEEVKLGKILGNASRNSETGERNREATKIVAAKDIGEHAQRAYIEEVLRLGIAGLSKYPDGTFRPEEYVTRANYAVIMADIVEKLGGKDNPEKQITDAASPFTDVTAESPIFKPIMVVTSRGIMSAKNKNEAVFSPLAPVTGADALLVIRKLKEDLKII